MLLSTSCFFVLSFSSSNSLTLFRSLSNWASAFARPVRSVSSYLVSRPISVSALLLEASDIAFDPAEGTQSRRITLIYCLRESLHHCTTSSAIARASTIC